ncbi:MAG: exo-alpha-sialidase [Armatimonadetes bacterium]|nr:exo-alpha-sialidase [Armatimonadota bacterium]
MNEAYCLPDDAHPTPNNSTYRHAIHPKLSVNRVILHQPKVEWTFTHFPVITHFGGKFYAPWSNGRRDEDEVGQRILISSSVDAVNWTEPSVLAHPVGPNIYTSAGFYISGKALVAYYSEYDLQRDNTKLFAKASPDGERWTPAKDLGVAVCPNQPPVRLSSGRLVMGGNFGFPYSDDPTGMGIWHWSSFVPDMVAEDNPWTFWHARDVARTPVDLCEASLVVVDDTQLRMMLRSTGKDYNGYLWCSHSFDQGHTWEHPAPTDFSDNDSKFQFGRLADGRFYYIGCPDLNQGKRNPLVFSLSEDGLNYNRHWIIADEVHRLNWPGKHKFGDYGCPSAVEAEGNMHVIVSRQKEAIEVISFDLSQCQ